MFRWPIFAPVDLGHHAALIDFRIGFGLAKELHRKSGLIVRYGITLAETHFDSGCND